MKIGKLEYALKFIQWCVPFWFYAFVVKSDLDFGWQWKIYTIMVFHTFTNSSPSGNY